MQKVEHGSTYNLSCNKSAHAVQQLEGFCILYFSAFSLTLLIFKLTERGTVRVKYLAYDIRSSEYHRPAMRAKS